MKYVNSDASGAQTGPEEKKGPDKKRVYSTINVTEEGEMDMGTKAHMLQLKKSSASRF